MRLKSYIILIFTCLTSSVSIAQVSAPKFSNEFMNLGVGARGFAMSGAVITSSNYAQSSYWNPSNMVGVSNDIDVSVMHAEFFAGISSYDYLSAVTALDSQSAIGVSIIRFGVDNIPDTRFLYDANGALNYDNITFFSAADYGLFLSYAKSVGKKQPITLGGNVKLVHRLSGNFARAWGFGIDVSASYEYKKWKFAAVARDITGTFNAWTHNSELLLETFQSTGNEVPKNSLEVTLPRLLLGASRQFPLGDNFTVLPEVNLEVTFDGKRNTLIKSSAASIEPRVGLEFGFRAKAFLRAGISEFQTIQDFDDDTYLSKKINFGLGVVLGNVDVDYALTDLADQAEGLYSHVFSLNIGINNTK